MEDSGAAMINLEGDEKVEGAAPSDPTPQPASDAADAVDAAASVEAPESNPPAAPASADPEAAAQPPAPPPQEPAGNGAGGGSMVEALHPTVPVALVETVNIDSVPAAVMQALHQMPVAVALVAGGADAQGGQRGGVKPDGQRAASTGGEGGDKVDKRFGKRSTEARAAVSQGMRSKASARREKDLRISLGDRLVVAQKLENKEITAKEAQELLGCCKSYISQMMKPSNLEKLKRKIQLGLDPKLTKAHLPKFPQMEEALNKWIEEVRANNPAAAPPVSMTQMQVPLPVSMSAMQEKAIELAMSMGVPDFKASNSWFSNFVKRYGLDRLGFQEDTLLPKADGEQGGAYRQQVEGQVVGQPLVGDATAAGEAAGMS